MDDTLDSGERILFIQRLRAGIREETMEERP